ncbi:MAG: hypothetical protein QM778_28680 [Myxococcales bacterium]
MGAGHLLRVRGSLLLGLGLVSAGGCSSGHDSGQVIGDSGPDGEHDASAHQGDGSASGGHGDGGVDDAGDGSCGPLYEPAVLGDSKDPPEADPALATQPHKYFTIKVKDANNGQAIEGATLVTTNKIVFTSDEHGVVAFYEPGLMGTDVYFDVKHPGYEVPADTFGGHGKALKPMEGGSGEITMNKTSGTAAAAQGDLQSRLVAANVPGPAACMSIRVVDSVSKRGVPLVDFAAFGEHAWSDSQGMIAYCHPDHVGSSVEFEVKSHGYALPASATKKSIATTKGGSITVEVERKIIAERLYRITGAGAYRDSVLLGLKTPLSKPNLNALVMGSDTGSTALYKGKLFWLWQDTDRAAYWLGNFHGTGATSQLPAQGGVSPDLGVELTYYQGNDGFAAPMCDGCEGGPAWMAGIVSVPDAQGQDALFGGYAIVNSDMSPKETGLVRFDDAKSHFTRVITDFLSRSDFIRPDGHAVKLEHAPGAYVHYFDRLRIPATAEAFMDPAKYEQFTPYGAGGSGTLQRASDGTLDYAWRAGGRHATSTALQGAGVKKQEDLDGHERAFDTGAGVGLTGNSLAWNQHRGRFVRIAQQLGGSSSFLGEIWHAEADTPVGPWVYAQKIISHDVYTFYNTFHHPEFEHGQYMYVEGTYTASFSDAEMTPRYNYNQMMYRVDLEDDRLIMPVPVYVRAQGTDLVTKRGLRRDEAPLAAAFLALDRATSESVPVSWSTASCGADRKLVVGDTPAVTPLFYALAANTTPAPAHTVGLYEFAHADGRRAYGLDGATLPAGFARGAKPIALVWENPIQVKLPVADYLGDLVVDAGPDQCLTLGAQSTKSVTLDTGKSSALGSAVKSVRWQVPGRAACEYVDGQSVSLDLPEGTHEIVVEVLTEAGVYGRDTVTVVVGK